MRSSSLDRATHAPSGTLERSFEMSFAASMVCPRETNLLQLLRSQSRGALRDDLARVFVKRARLGQGINRFLKLRVVFEIDLVSFREAENGNERFFSDFALDPGKILGDVRVGVLHLLFIQVRDKYFHRTFVRSEILCNFRFRSQEVGGESAHAALVRKKHIAAKQR